MKEMEQCRLCLKIRALRKSHVLPEFLYRPVYDADSRCLHLDGATGKHSRVQQGYYERLLCEECESIFQGAERYFSLLWYSRDPLPNTVDVPYVVRSGFEFETFLRFHLSILWRASAAQNSMFSAVTLGPFEEPLRQFLHGDIKALQHEPAVYGIILRFPQTNELLSRMIVLPVWTRIDGIKIYNFIFGGCSWYYCVSKQGSPFPEPLRLKRPGTMIMPVIDYTEEVSITRVLKAWQRSRAGSTIPANPTDRADGKRRRRSSV